ncbi:MAG: HEAT repeat domain-containing protein [Planctomycetes bacterium]|nr:HEAT repeat domain-containing protein [Planctomycetota bacterium]
MFGDKKRLAALMGLAAVLVLVFVYLHVWPRSNADDEAPRGSSAALSNNGEKGPAGADNSSNTGGTGRTGLLKASPSYQQIKKIVQNPRPSQLPVLKKAARSPDARVRETAVIGMGRLGKDTDPTVLMDALRSDPSPAVRVAAATALGRLKYWDAGPLLIDALSDPDPRVRSRAGAALNRIVGVDLGYDALAPDRDRAIQRIRDWWPKFYQGYLQRQSEKGLR